MRIKQTILYILFTVSTFGALSIQLTPIVSAKCAGIETSIINCEGEETTSDISKTGLWNLLISVINIFSAGVGILAFGGIIYGSVLYASSGGNSEQTKKAKDLLFNVIVGIVAYYLMFAFINWLIPGGLFNK